MFSSHSGAIKPTGAVWMWGLGSSGQRGDLKGSSQTSPVAVVGNHSFVELWKGSIYTLARKDDDGSVWAWGANTYGQLGNLSTTAKSSPVLVLGNHSFQKIGAGNNTSIALKSDGSAWTWGANTQGQLGTNTDTTHSSSPVAVVGGHSFIDVMGGATHMAGIKSDGTVWTWGLNSYGLLGDGTWATNRSSPTLVIGNMSFVLVACGSNNTHFLMADGTAWAVGYGGYGALGRGGGSASSPVVALGNHSFIKLVAGTNFALGLKADGSIWGWGLGSSGQMGNNTTTTVNSSPVAVVGNHSFTDVECGADFVVALKANGELWSWGNAADGRLGIGSVTDKASPVLVIGSHVFSAIARYPQAPAPPSGNILNLQGLGWGSVSNLEGLARASVKNLQGVTA